jgi:hypothetical protein
MIEIESGKGTETATVRARVISEIDRAMPSRTRKTHIVVATLFAIVGLGIPVLLHLLRARKSLGEEEQLLVECLRAAREFAERAQAVAAFPLMVNGMLRAPGSKIAPGLVLITFDPNARTQLMADLAMSVASAGAEGNLAQSWSSAQRDFTAQLMEDEDFKPFRRRGIPSDMTGGLNAVSACDLMIDPALLPGGFLGDECPILPCLAEPGDSGRILLLPHWLVDDRPTSRSAGQRDDFLTALVHFEALRRRGDRSS